VSVCLSVCLSALDLRNGATYEYGICTAYWCDSLFVASVVEWSVCSTAVREGTGSIPAGDNVVIPVFPPKATCPLSSDQYLAL